MKALGYSRNEIAGKYLGYALLATVGGSILGVLFGEKVFPFIIVFSYGIMYHHIPKVLVPYNMYYGLIASLFAIGTITVATLASCMNELRETPAVLMRPPAPKSGKRTLLERIPFIWNLLNFSWKSTIRNLLRYKKRFFMTIFGIGGCMGLMVFGYGLKDSIYEITQLQYTDIQVFKGMIYLQDGYSEEEVHDLYQFMDDYEEVPDYMNAYMKNITLVNGKKERSAVEMVMMEESKIPDYVHFRDRVSHEKYQLTDEGVIVCEKTAKLLGVGIGDTIQIRDEENGNVDVVIQNITENYMGHYLYLTPAYFEKVHGHAPENNTLLFQTREGVSNEQVEKVGLQIMKQDAVLSIGYMHDIQQTLDNLLSTLNLVIIVLIISAGLLAFVVLYNLNEVNITERRRELATLKVLGFHDSEVSSYVYRENIVLTVIGVLVGCIFGKLLHEFTISTVEVDAAMFGRIILPKSYLYSMLFTIFFSVLINVVMHFKLKKIDMVESLKSIE
ncbi:MAG: ABC transporter permease [Dorea sp.]|nr:ABC transporter permease [Dorea sp.]